MLKIFGIKIKELRLDAGLKQSDIAKILNVSKTTICQWETSRQEPSLEDVVSIAEIFNVSTDFLLGQEEEGNKKKEM